MKLKEYPKEELPRERLIKYGASNLSNEDLISIILNTGTKNCNVKEVSKEILRKIKGINNLNDLSIRELTSVNGVGEAKAINIIAAIELGKRVSNLVINEKILVNESAKVNKYFSNQIASEKQENLLVILVNNAKRLIGYKKMFVGTDNASLVSIKEILNYAIRERASGIIIMHNHPSGNLNPSNADNELTSNLSKACKLVGIPLLDHIITAGANYYSYLEGKVIYEK